MLQPLPKRISAGWLILLWWLIVVTSETSRAWADASLEGINPAQWRLVWTSDPSTSATLCWSTAEAGELHRVYLRQENRAEATPVEAQRNGRYSAKSPDLFFHHVHLKDLEPATQISCHYRKRRRALTTAEFCHCSGGRCTTEPVIWC